MQVEAGDVVEAGDAEEVVWWWTLLAANQLHCLHSLIDCSHLECRQQPRAAREPRRDMYRV